MALRSSDTEMASTKANARGRRQTHAARLTGKSQAAKPKAARKKNRGDEVRADVLHASVECFGAFGFAGTSTRAVAERAGISHPLLLYHFGSKELLWRSTLENVIERYRASLEERWSRIDASNPVEGLRAFVENFIEFSAQVPQLHRIMTQQSTQASPDRINWLIENHLRSSFETVCSLIRKGQRQGMVRKGEPARLYYGVIGLGGTLFSVSSEFSLLTGKDVFSRREVRKTIESVCEYLFV